MQKSESIAKLAEALSKAQGAMKNAIKDSDNPFFKSKYADLASVSDACRNELASNGLAVTQLPEMKDGKLVLSYVLMHSSGEWICGELEMNPVKNDPQGIGSAITYARRYTLAGIAGIATEDDDGNAASGKDGKDKAKPTDNKSRESVTIGASAQTLPLPPPRPNPNPPNGSGAAYISEPQCGRFIALCKKHNWSEEDAKKLLADFGVHSRKLIMKADYERICGIVESGDLATYLDFKSNTPAAS